MRSLLRRHPLGFCLAVVGFAFLFGVVVVAPRLDALELRSVEATAAAGDRANVTVRVGYRLATGPGGTLRIRVLGASAETVETVPLGPGRGEFELTLAVAGVRPGTALAVAAELESAASQAGLGQLFAGRRRVVTEFRVPKPAGS